MTDAKTSLFQPGDRVYFKGWTPPTPDFAPAEPAEWATVLDYPTGDPDRVSVVYDGQPGAVFPAAVQYLVSAADAPEPDPKRLLAPAPVVCICGSTRFRHEMADANRRLTLDGSIVVAPGVFGHSGDAMTEEQKTALDALHLQKIDLAQSIYVVNPGGYIGESTTREIAYAERTGKPVAYLVPLQHQGMQR